MPFQLSLKELSDSSLKSIRPAPASLPSVQTWTPTGMVHRAEKFTKNPYKSEGRWELWSNLILVFTSAVPAQIICPSCDVTPTQDLHFCCWKHFSCTLSSHALARMSQSFSLSSKPVASVSTLASSLSQVIHLGMQRKACGFSADIQFLSRTVAWSAWLLYTYLDSMSRTKLQNSHLWKYLKKPQQPNRYNMWEAACRSLLLNQTGLEGIWLFAGKAFRAVI